MFTVSVSLPGGVESKPVVRGVGGRSVSIKTPPASRSRHGPFKTMPLRWSFGHREKRPGASVELVEYLESRRRPRSTSQSIVPLLTRAAGGDEKSASPRPDGTLPTKSEDSGRNISQGAAGVPLSSCHLNHHPALGSLDDGLNTARTRTGNANQDIKLPKKFDLPLTVMSSVGDEKQARRPEGQKMTTWKGSGQVGSQSSPPSPSTGLLRNFKDNGTGTLPKMKARAAVEERAPDKDKGQGTFTLLRSVFWKKEHKRAVRVESSPTAPPVSLVSDRLSPAMNEQARGSSPALRIRESPARGLGYHMERDIRSAPSSLHLPRKASRPPKASTAGTSQRTIPGEQNSYGTLQRVKYHTLSLGRKKSLPESSF